ncbi:MAG: cytochrome oxidase [Alphaproteobacteria bacterium]|nr:cytochrome oxidase [Alphaproteobacteria bacterium]
MMFGSGTEFTGKHMLFMMLAFFGVVIGVNLIMATFASSTWTGLIVKNSYVASQDFNAKLEKARTQDALGWTSTAALNGRELSLKILDAEGNPLNALNVVARVYRPVAEAEDHDVALTAQGAGAYGAKVGLGAGLWEVSVLATDRGDRTYEQIFRFIVKDRTQ